MVYELQSVLARQGTAQLQVLEEELEDQNSEVHVALVCSYGLVTLGCMWVSEKRLHNTAWEGQGSGGY